MKKLTLVLFAMALSASCAGTGKAISQGMASTFGADWIIVQYAQNGTPFHCWKIRDAAVDDSEGGNINWKDREHGHLVHLTGWENRVQVVGGDYASAGRLLGVDAARCDNGVYPSR